MSTLFITQQGGYLRNVGGRFVVTHKDEEILALPEAMVECVVLLGMVQVSTQAATHLLDMGVPLLYLSRSGKFRGMLQPGYPKNVERRLAQYECSIDPVFVRDAARAVVTAKIETSICVLRKWERNGWLPADLPARALRQCIRRLPECTDLAALRTAEAQAAKIHFHVLANSLPPGFTWEGRNRRPPRDPVNALLSLSYMLALGFAVSAAYAGGLDPHIGFLHGLEYGRPSFALDVLEPLRAEWCDHTVMRVLQAEELGPEDFEETKADGCRLTREGLNLFIRRFQERAAPEQEGRGIRSVTQRLVRETQEAIRGHRTLAWSAALREEAA